MSDNRLLRSTAVFSGMTFLSRLAGYLRDWLQASLFGAGPAVSAFVVAYRIPNYLRRIFAEGSFSAAFVMGCSRGVSRTAAGNPSDIFHRTMGSPSKVKACGPASSLAIGMMAYQKRRSTG